MEQRINANAIITNSQNEILFIKLKKGPYSGSLCIPGGGINPGELSHETIKREIKEETGIELDEDILPFGFCELINNKINKHRIVLLLHSTADGNPKETEEGISKWMKYEDVKQELIPFARESIELWMNKKTHFKLID